ncbi:hypothetical protein [Roseimaritima ulvae]|uniref:Uncharacterized protein n=1 Tax=Roseimaritima ulvae TaxID=980254 RepID=A0A5B9QJY4_9BACT|nr:hypothetical protein [Roseimaritima ulvae]QEG39244.1 hypothetical protein UC8_12050 [Roseimaritima ulvae]
MKKSTWLLLSAVIVASLAAPLLACKVPVFRYALERWAADDYRIVAVVDGEPSAPVAAAIARLQEADKLPLNAEVEVLDLSKLSEAELWSVEGVDDTSNVPVLQVFYPEKSDARQLCWSGELSVDNINRWIDSPLRETIASDLASGVSATWILAEGPDEQENTLMHTRLQQALATATEKISVPEGVIRRDEAARVIAEDPSASMDDILRSDIPLRIEFSIQRLGYNDPAESALSAMLEGRDGEITRPFVCPVFGRGRMAEPLNADVFSEAAVVSACEYLVGECSCSVKALSPGIDMLLHNDWQAQLGNKIVMVNAPAPTTATVIEIPAGKPDAPALDKPASEETLLTAAASSKPWTWQWVALILGAAGIGVCTTLALRQRKSG